MNQENTFKVKVRRNWLLGLWPAEKLGLPESLREAYQRPRCQGAGGVRASKINELRATACEQANAE